jgi:RNA ligase
MDIENLKKMVDEGYISVQKHPKEELYIYNYTAKAQYDRVWNEETLMCRGLILDDKYNIVSRPFKKFFNYEEYKDNLPDGEFTVYEKLDGSLAISYWIGDKLQIATRGSFISEQAQYAMKLLDQYDTSKLNPDYTYLLEIIYPANRIVVEYKKEELVLLAIIDTKTGEELPLESDIFPLPKKYNLTFDQMFQEQRENKNDEGFVIKWNKDSFRLKIKNEEYVRLHRLITNTTARSIWDIMRTNGNIDELLDRVPDEFFGWVKDWKEKFEKMYSSLKEETERIYSEVKDMPTRKEQAIYITEKAKRPSLVFARLDEKEVDYWKLLYPPHELPFKKEE